MLRRRFTIPPPSGMPLERGHLNPCPRADSLCGDQLVPNWTVKFRCCTAWRRHPSKVGNDIIAGDSLTGEPPVIDQFAGWVMLWLGVPLFSAKPSTAAIAMRCNGIHICGEGVPFLKEFAFVLLVPLFYKKLRKCPLCHPNMTLRNKIYLFF